MKYCYFIMLFKWIMQFWFNKLAWISSTILPAPRALSCIALQQPPTTGTAIETTKMPDKTGNWTSEHGTGNIEAEYILVEIIKLTNGK